MLTGVILAGGQNRRMNGKMKSFLSVGAETILDRQQREMLTICDQLLLVTRQPAYFSYLEADSRIKILTDEYGQGPLAGIYMALSYVNTGDIWVVACDMPYICAKAAKMLQSQRQETHSDAAIPVIDGFTQPLHGVYHPGTVDCLQQILDKGEYKVQAWLDQIRWTSVPDKRFISQNIATTFTMNVNTPADYNRALQMRQY